MSTTKPQFRIWWIPQVPGKAFYQEVTSVLEGKRLLNVLARYDIFQLENNIKPDFCNAGGLQVLENDGDDEWTDWYNEDGCGIDDLSAEEIAMEFSAAMFDLEEALAFRQTVRNDKSGNAVSTGAYKDALDWIEKAAKKVVESK